MKKAVLGLAMLAALVFAVSVASAASPTLQCFQGLGDGFGENGTCTLTGGGTTAQLNTIDGDNNPNNNYAGVYIGFTNINGALIGSVTKLQFAYRGTGAAGGSPRLSIPIDENGDGVFDFPGTEEYAFIDTLGCNNGNPNSGILDAINDPTCLVTYEGVTYPNWAAFVAAHPTYRVAADALAFVIVDQPGQFSIGQVIIGTGSPRP